MFNQLKRSLFNWYLSQKNETWDVRQGIKVLIQTNQYFDRFSWEEVIKEITGTHESIRFNIQFCNNKTALIKNFINADAAFIFGFSSYLAININQHKLIYFPIIGKEIFTNKRLPDSYLIKQPIGISSPAIAEYCLIMAINYYRNFKYAFYYQKNRNWSQSLLLKNEYISIKKKIIGVFGVGNVGKLIASIFKNYGCQVYGLDNKCDASDNNIDKWFSINQISNFFSESDIIIISLPFNSTTQNLITSKELNYLDKSKLLINISRGQIVNELDLYNVLKTKSLGGAIVDTFIGEPLNKRNPFFKLDNIIITPHIAGNINLFRKEIQIDFLNNIIDQINRNFL